MRLLLVEDELVMASWLGRAFKRSKFVTDHAPDAATAEGLLAAHDYDVVVLDLGLPDKHGLRVLVEMRQRGHRTPVLILTAQGSLADRVKGLNLGADDFLTKPFALDELEARLAALVRRSRGLKPAAVECGSLSRPDAGRAFKLGDAWLQLTPRESAALAVLLAHSGSPVEKSHLSDKVFPSDSDAGPDAIELVLHRLRRKLVGGDVRINTVRGLGYMLETFVNKTGAS